MQKAPYHVAEAPAKVRAGREPQPAMKAACEVWMAARALPAIKSLPGKNLDSLLEE